MSTFISSLNIKVRSVKNSLMRYRLLLVHCQKSFPVSQTSSMYEIAGFGRSSEFEDLERLPADWEREVIFHCKSTLSLEIFLNHSYNSLFLAIPVAVK